MTDPPIDAIPLTRRLVETVAQHADERAFLHAGDLEAPAHQSRERFESARVKSESTSSYPMIHHARAYDS